MSAQPSGLTVDVPGGEQLNLHHLVLDLNGTLTNRGELIAGVAGAIERLRGMLELHLLTADTFGRGQDVAGELGVTARRIRTGVEKASVVEALGASSVVAIGNGRNDVSMLRAAALGIAVLGPEGTAVSALIAADIACRSILEALDLLLDPIALSATLRR